MFKTKFLLTLFLLNHNLVTFCSEAAAGAGDVAIESVYPSLDHKIKLFAGPDGVKVSISCADYNISGRAGYSKEKIEYYDRSNSSNIYPDGAYAFLGAQAIALTTQLKNPKISKCAPTNSGLLNIDLVERYKKLHQSISKISDSVDERSRAVIVDAAYEPWDFEQEISLLTFRKMDDRFREKSVVQTYCSYPKTVTSGCDLLGNSSYSENVDVTPDISRRIEYCLTKSRTLSISSILNTRLLDLQFKTLTENLDKFTRSKLKGDESQEKVLADRLVTLQEAMKD